MSVHSIASYFNWFFLILMKSSSSSSWSLSGDVNGNWLIVIVFDRSHAREEGFDDDNMHKWLIMLENQFLHFLALFGLNRNIFIESASLKHCASIGRVCARKAHATSMNFSFQRKQPAAQSIAIKSDRFAINMQRRSEKSITPFESANQCGEISTGQFQSRFEPKSGSFDCFTQQLSNAGTKFESD